MRNRHRCDRLIDLDAWPAGHDTRGVAEGFPEAVRDSCGVVLLADLAGQARADVLPMTLAALRRLAHRGAVDADWRTGDGAGVLTQIPFDLLQPELDVLGLGGRDRNAVGVGMVFLPRRKNAAARARMYVRNAIAAQGVFVAGWRPVPVEREALGTKARTSMPRIEQVIVVPRMPMTADVFEERLFRARRAIDARIAAYGPPDLYVVSLSHRTIVYKALLRAPQLREFYADLKNPAFLTSFAVLHNRYSTNTEPSWPRTQPFRQLAHNGEINTIDGNRRWMEARARQGAGRALGLIPVASSPLLPAHESDSAILDEAFRLLTAA